MRSSRAPGGACNSRQRRCAAERGVRSRSERRAESRAVDYRRVLVQLPPQPVQAAAPLLLPGLPGPDPEGEVRVPLRDLPGADDLPADRHRLARRRGAGPARPVESLGERSSDSWSSASSLNFFIGILAYLAAARVHPAAAGRQGDGRGLLRLGLGRHVRDLPRRAGDRAHRLRRLHAGHAGGHGDPGLPGRPVPRLPAPAPGDGRAGQHARRARLRPQRRRRSGRSTARVTATTTASERSRKRWPSRRMSTKTATTATSARERRAPWAS